MDYTSLYSTRIQSSFDDDQADIFRAILGRHAAKDGSKVTLINYFKGLPITTTATILDLEHGNFDLDVNPLQAVAISIDRYTLIRSKLFPFPLAARVLYVNIKKHMVTLNKLSYIEILAEKRAAVRVELDFPLHVSMTFDDQVIDGMLLDISTQGIALEVKEYLSLGRGSAATVKFMLPDLASRKQEPAGRPPAHAADPRTAEHHKSSLKQTMVKMPATLVAIEGDGSPYRCKLKIMPEKHQEQLISRFSFHRQVEIIHGLKEQID